MIANGKLPEKPSKDDCATEDLDFLWELCTQCWRKEPDTRPTATEASHLLSTPRAFTIFLRDSLRAIPNPGLPPLGTLDATGRLELGQLRVCGTSVDVFDGLLKRNRSHTNNVYELPKRVAVKLFRVFLHDKNDDKSEVSTQFESHIVFHICVTSRLTFLAVIFHCKNISNLGEPEA